mgnify:CR=1 FL=1
MGKLQIIKSYYSDLMDGIKHFVETGTGQGHSLKFMHEFTKGELDSYSTVEIWPSLFEEAVSKFPWANCYSGHSPEAMKLILEKIPVDEPIIFWLDAHFPGADYGLKPRQQEATDEVWPLESELQVIASFRPKGQDIILIDDHRMIEDIQPNMKKHCPNWEFPGMGFVEKQFGSSHDFQICPLNESYLILTPKKG